MASKRYYVRYLEARNELQVVSSPSFVMITSFDAGLVISRNNGHRRKQDALRWVAKVNAAAGKPIAEYAGAYIPST